MVSETLAKAAQAVGGELITAAEASIDEWKGVRWEDDGTSDIQPSFPIIKIVQMSSMMDGAKKHIGNFWHSDREGDAAFEEDTEVVGLVKRNTRALFEDGNNTPICRSDDGVAPVAGGAVWTREYISINQQERAVPLHAAPMNCGVCPFSTWGQNNEKPICAESLVILAQRTDDGSLAQLRISGMSIRVFKSFVAKYLKPKGMPLYSKKLILTTAERKREGTTNQWQELEIHPTQLSIEDAVFYGAVLRDERQRFEASVAEGDVEWASDSESNTQGEPFE